MSYITKRIMTSNGRKNEGQNIESEKERKRERVRVSESHDKVGTFSLYHRAES